ncbi:phage terminase small subunit [Edwardsiella tarda]|uniref:phage terminase small subunit n=1 Tax=Edwardsiella tarda TaxID=636 RepID=UPI0002F6EA72|nr:phage terminase small subunit [Edwardsiella tarda]
MRLSPARQHRLRMQAQLAAREEGSGRHASGYELMLLQLSADRRQLKGIQSTQRKAELKRELLPKYTDWIDGVLAADAARQDDVLLFLMVWRIDAGDYAGGLQIAAHALRHGWVMPQTLGRRNVQTVVVEELADQAEAALRRQATFPAEILQDALTLTDGFDMPDQSLARLHKAIGAVLSADQPEVALHHLTLALQLDPHCGVKKEKQQLERRLRNANG